MKIIIGIAVVVSIISCNTKTKVSYSDFNINDSILEPTYTALLPDKDLDSIVFSFIRENPCDSCIYEMYVDKVYPTKILITLKERFYNIEYLKRQNPLFAINFNQKKFFVYSGLEDIFSGNKKAMIYKDKNSSGNQFVEWSIVIDSGKYNVNKMSEEIPFFPSEPVKFR